MGAQMSETQDRKPPMEALRDVVLLEADWHNSHADRLDIWAKHFGDHEFGKVLKVAANGCRARAGILNGALTATAPEVLARTSS